MTKERAIVWVPKKIAEQIENIESPEHLNELMQKYISSLEGEIKQNIEYLDESVLRYKAFLLNAEVKFKEVTDEMLDRQYNAWEDFDKQMPSLEGKVNKLISVLDPLENKLSHINSMIDKVKTWQIKDLLDILEQIDNSSESTKKLLSAALSNKDIQS